MKLKNLDGTIKYDRVTGLKKLHRKILDDKFAEKITDEEITCLVATYGDIENGTLIELPCKVGDLVFYVYDGKIETYVVDKIGCDNEGWYFNVDDEDHFDHYFDDTSEIGVTVFFDRAEAEAQLKSK